MSPRLQAVRENGEQNQVTTLMKKNEMIYNIEPVSEPDNALTNKC